MNNRIIVRRKLEKGKKYISFIIRLRHSLSEVFFAENSWGKVGSSTFVLGADQRLSGEGVFNNIYYCPLGFRALCTCIPLCMRLVILMVWLCTLILSIVNSMAYLSFLSGDSNSESIRTSVAELLV